MFVDPYNTISGGLELLKSISEFLEWILVDDIQRASMIDEGSFYCPSPYLYGDD